MNLYLHDIYVHAGMQYAIYGGFRGFSCEEDEGLFSTVKHVIHDLTNHRDNVLETVMLRVATERQTHAEFGSVSHSESSISKIADSLEDEDAFLPIRICQGEDYNTLIEVLEVMGYDESWWERKEEGVTFSTLKAPAGKGEFFGLHLFFWFDRFLFFSADLSKLKINDNFWAGYDRLRERDQEMEEEIKGARQAGPAEEAPRVRMTKTDSDVLAALLRRHPALTPHKFAKKAKEEGVSLNPQQVKGWFSRNKKKVLGGDGSHN